MVAICYSCSSDEPETENWNWNWDEEYEMGFPGVLASFEQLTPRNVVWHGKLLPFDEATKAMLQVAACEDTKATMTIKTKSPGEVKKCIGTKAFEIDRLIVEGPMNKDDCTYIKRCIAAGNLHSLDLSKAQFTDNTVPENSFVLYEYPENTILWPTYLPLFHISLPDDVEVGRYAFMNSLITELDLTRIKSLNDFCFKRNVWLSKTLDVPSDIEHIGYGVFEDAGDGEIIVNFEWRKIPPFTFRLANVKKLNISDNVEAIERDGLIGIQGLETLILPSSVKK